jgi:glycosyltransferase involved in cell wall biosynthesis
VVFVEKWTARGRGCGLGATHFDKRAGSKRMDITVILCTFNRCQSLPTALNSVGASVLPANVDWEVLVVDNNSRDNTRGVVEDFARRFPGRFRYAFEAQQGKSFALNNGIRDARGTVVAFLDDDVTVEPDWLHNLTGNLFGKEWAGSGGKIILQWPANVPDWLSTEGPNARHGFPGFDHGPVAKELEGPPFGCNMAFRKEMFEKYGDFRIDLGPTPVSQIRAEDTEFGRRVIAAGEHLRYEPGAIVYHPVPENRLNQKYFLDWCYDNGRALVLEFPVRPVHLLCSFVAWTMRWMVATDRRERFFRKLIVRQKLGEMTEYSRRIFSGKGSQPPAYQQPKRESTVRV